MRQALKVPLVQQVLRVQQALQGLRVLRVPRDPPVPLVLPVLRALRVQQVLQVRLELPVPQAQPPSPLGRQRPERRVRRPLSLIRVQVRPRFLISPCLKDLPVLQVPPELLGRPDCKEFKDLKESRVLKVCQGCPEHQASMA